ncbi:MAG: hypothetical protein IKK57_06045 [Clostridia bacterium]|nr:hypothetical protein [Clostridia bacterium]
MLCPYCSKEMTDGNLSCDGRSSLIFSPGDKRMPFFDFIGGTGRLTAAQGGAWSGIRVKAGFCRECRKIIIDTDVVK